MEKVRQIIITSALPYANGDIHLGHLVEHMITDFWARFQKMKGHKCLAICADDTHGAPIMIAARKKGISPEKLIAEVRTRHLDDFRDFDIKYDHYSSTHSEMNEHYCHEFYQRLKDKSYIEERKITQLYCEHDKMFLPDRFVKGDCPKCKALDQYGDSCDSCGAVYETRDLIGPSCTLCGTKPVEKDSNHMFVHLKNFTDFLKKWVPKHTDKAVYNKLSEWLEKDGLKDWCLTRDKPYFGFKVPGTEKYYYVWFDAPIGYLSTTAEWCEKNNCKVEDFWKNKESEIYHNIGKDIIYFHSLFWPVMLKVAGWNTPSGIFVHGMLTVNGKKLSKSKGTFINARTYLEHLDPVYLRYYFACKLSNSIADFDLNFDDFLSRVNSDLVGKITNIASRGFQMLAKHFDSTLSSMDQDGKELFLKARALSHEISDHYEQRNFSKAIITIRQIADDVNKYFDDRTPWKLVKEDPEKTQQILTTILNVFRLLSIYLKPILPSYTSKVESLFLEESYTWETLQSSLENKKVGPFSHLIKRMEKKPLEMIVEASKEEPEGDHKKENKSKDSISSEISIDDFSKVDLRVAKIVKAESVEKAQKLVKLYLSLGEHGERVVFAGIKKAYDPEKLEGKLVVVVANLKSRKMKFGLSQGMVLAASQDESGLWLISPDSGAKEGAKVS